MSGDVVVIYPVPEPPEGFEGREEAASVVSAPTWPTPLAFDRMTVEASVAPLLIQRVTADDPLPLESHPYRPSVDLSVAVLCVECDAIYAKEIEGRKAGDVCPRCGCAIGFELVRVVKPMGEGRAV